MLIALFELIDKKNELNNQLNGYLEELADGMFRRHFGGLTDNATPVSYTHLDVYKRQLRARGGVLAATALRRRVFGRRSSPMRGAGCGRGGRALSLIHIYTSAAPAISRASSGALVVRSMR